MYVYICMCIIDVHKPDVSRFAEQTPRDWWSLAVLKPFRKRYIDGGDASYFFFFRRNKVTYIVFRVFFSLHRHAAERTERFTFYVQTFGPFGDKEHIN
jgi:hypothetical protein